MSEIDNQALTSERSLGGFSDSGNKAIAPRIAGDGGPLPGDPPVVSHLRYMWALECGHKVLADAPPPENAREFCPGCGFVMTVTEHDIYLDEEAAAWRP
jgi:hypothetical protein